MYTHLLAATKQACIVLFLFAVFFAPNLAFATDENPIGTIDKPEAVANFDTAGGIADGDIGILSFTSRMITYISVIAGIWAFANVLLAGYIYITSSGNSQAHIQVRDKLVMSVLGLILIVSVYAVAGILGTIFFGNSLYFLNPTVTGPGAI